MQVVDVKQHSTMGDGKHFTHARLRQMTLYTESGNLSLDLSCSNITRLPPSITSLVGLQHLDISDNPEMRKLPKDFYALTKLEHIEAVHCGFARFPEGLCSLRSLQHLRLSLNNLQAFPAALPDLVNLQTLELDMCSLTEIPDCITSLTNLRRLDVKCNKLQTASFPADMGRLQLDELDISNNELVTLPECLCEISTLHILKASHCAMVRITSSICHLEHLMELRLSYNSLDSVPHEICGISSLESLHLDNNRLTSLPRSLNLLTNIDSKDGFSVFGNRLNEPPQDICDRGWESVLEYFNS